MLLAIILAIVAVLLAVVVYLRQVPAGSPPIEQGWIPFVGAGLNFAGGPLQYATRLFQKHGEVFTIKMFGKRFTFMVGPEAHHPFFTRTDKQLDQGEPYKFSIPIFGPHVIYDSDVEHRRQQMHFVKDSLSAKALASYVPLIQKEVELYFSTKLKDEGEFDIRDALSELIILTAGRCLMGAEIRERLMDKVAALYQTLDEGLTPISVVFPYLPIPAHNRRDKARLEMVSLFQAIMEERKKNPDVPHEDVLNVFMNSRYKDAESALSAEEVAGLMIALLFAGQHTSSVTGSWTGLLALQSKERVWRRLEQEQREVMDASENKDQLDIQDLVEMKFLHCCIKEALRMFPPLIFVMRAVVEPFEYKNYHIPKGDVLFVSPALSHRVESSGFVSPNEFDPDRFMPERTEDSKTKYSFLGFGAGRHACMGG
eukprot:TRINITY_DN4995_c0_g2_i1.p1 TRINITY_DN4995_c0_g2~~TRINITY_DN4995_c0_g2_i1.p1  ORF type:complete len:426 (-),score=72.89 TRINITY_DN4995_c0_g2_i1:122-1399(-)